MVFKKLINLLKEIKIRRFWFWDKKNGWKKPKDKLIKKKKTAPYKEKY